MKRRFCVLLAMLLTVRVAQATELTPEQVSAAATTWVRSVTADARPDASVVRLEPYTYAGRTTAYILHLSTGGFALCGADDRLLPVYLYSPRSAYDTADPLNRDVLVEIGQRLIRLDEAERTGDPILNTYAAELASRAARWQDLQAGRVPAVPTPRSGDPVYMVLPVTDFWHQGSPYNQSCPVLTPGSSEHTKVGCVATAMSQILYYWKWPLTGVGTGSCTQYTRFTNDWIGTPLDFNPNIPAGWMGGNRLRYNTTTQELEMNGYWDYSLCDGAKYFVVDPNGEPDPDLAAALTTLYDDLTEDTRTHTADFGTTTFDWNAMHDSHVDPYGAEDAAVALLCYTVGVSVSMGHGSGSSATDTAHAADAYSDHFRYDPDATYVTRNVDTMMEEIRWLRPVQMSGHSEAGGHSFVACGYNNGVNPPEFLINKGWGGGAGPWYSVDEFFPDNQNHVIRIAPQSIVRFVGGSFGGDGSPARPYQNLATAMSDAPDNTILIMEAGSAHAVAGSAATLSRPMILKGQQVTISKE
jgi:hypothetical protein